MAQWWERSPPTNVARVQIPASMAHVGWVCCSFSPLLREVFLWVLRFSLFKNQHFQIIFQFYQESGRRTGTTLWMCYLQIIITYCWHTGLRPPFEGKSPLELFVNRKPRNRLSILRGKSSSKENVFKDNLDLTTKQRLRNPRKLFPGFWTSKSRPLSWSDIKNNYVHGSYLHLCEESYVANPISKTSGGFSPRKWLICLLQHQPLELQFQDRTYLWFILQLWIIANHTRGWKEEKRGLPI